MNTAFSKQGIGLVMSVIGLVGYLDMVSDILSIETINFARSALFVFAIGAAIVAAFQLRKQEKIEEKFASLKINRTPKKINLFLFLFLGVAFLVVLIFLLTNYTFPREEMYMILFTNLIILYGLSFVFRILI